MIKAGANIWDWCDLGRGLDGPIWQILCKAKLVILCPHISPNPVLTKARQGCFLKGWNGDQNLWPLRCQPTYLWPLEIKLKLQELKYGYSYSMADQEKHIWHDKTFHEEATWVPPSLRLRPQYSLLPISEPSQHTNFKPHLKQKVTSCHHRRNLKVGKIYLKIPLQII